MSLVERRIHNGPMSGFWHFPLICDFSTLGESIDLFRVAEEDSTREWQNIPLEVQFRTYKVKLQPTRDTKTVKHDGYWAGR